ncbi:hypothetical protein HO133_005265 [Letharia lupina]|uniref:F-box domain-containing protein n=1 Tax=Letharia lupina TaxID=560253 RepID=A0A8H6C8H8_9LECA|nr:uncharacterized protein HO133_005265 [Letharia lupina]KAF6218723.1 hypothetical protein HO133_005265 [Letharia lupina]
MSLPSETLSQIFSLLPKSSLKAIRLACKIFYDTATPLLFDSIFVSARHSDREITDLVATRFPNSIKTLTFSTECYFDMTWPEFSSQIDILPRTSKCQNPTVHLKQAKRCWELHCKLGLERQRLYESGAVHVQLCHLLNTLPSLCRIVITDRRRRQDLSWLQEALMGEILQRLPPPATLRHALADLQLLREQTPTHSPRSYRDFWKWLRSSLKSEDAQALAQMQAVHSVGCDHFAQEPPYPGLCEAGSQHMPQNPWAEIMTALHNSSNVSVHTISIEPRDANCGLPFVAVQACGPHMFLSTTRVLAHLTKLELCMDNAVNFVKPKKFALLKMSQALQHPTKMLSAASNLQSLTLGFVRAGRPSDLYGTSEEFRTGFGMLLGGCQLPLLSTLRLRNITFWEDDFCAFLRSSPDLRDLSLQGFFMEEQGLFRGLPYAHPRAWERLMDTMKDTLHRLDSFHISERQLCRIEHRAERLGAMPGFDAMPGFHVMVQDFLFSEGINPYAGMVG